MKSVSKFHSRIATNISKKLIILYLFIYLLILGASFLILGPKMYRNSYDQHVQIQSVFTNEYSDFQNKLSESLNHLSVDFFQLVKEYENNPTDINRARIIQKLSIYTASNDAYATIGIQLPNGEYLSSFYYQNLPQNDILSQNKHYKNMLTNNINAYYSPIYSKALILELFPNTYFENDMLFYSINHRQGTDKYTLTLFYNVSNILKKNLLLNQTYFDYYFILDKYGEYIYQSDSNVNTDNIVDASSITQTSGQVTTAKGIYFYQLIPSSGWVVISYISYFHLLKEFLQIMGIVTALYLISPILYSLMLLPLARKQLLPLKTLADTMSTYQAGTDISVDIHTQDEIEDLGTIFNTMVKEINQQIESIKAQSHENAIVSYKLLATQIDPHFIYNTMNIINVMARKEKTAEIVEINTALTRILRERLNSKLTIYDTIRNEYETMLQYETIMNYRYEHQILIHYDIDEALMDRYIPKNILQPLVENCFYHGFGNMETPLTGNIDIMIYPIDQEIIIEVSDNGQGIEPERLEQLLTKSYSIYEDKKPHIGIHNIQQRLFFIYGNRQSMEIHSTIGIGTNIVITIPMDLPEHFYLS